MRTKLMAGIAALVLAASSVVAVTPADAQWRGHRGGGWHHGGGWHRGGGGGAIAGFAAGALLGGALASRPYGYYDDGYYAQGYVPGGGDAVGYCMSRFKSYDPGSGTYLGYDGARHPCP
ncbi:MAG: BA14K family protein [Pseudolabrys sp.]